MMCSWTSAQASARCPTISAIIVTIGSGIELPTQRYRCISASTLSSSPRCTLSSTLLLRAQKIDFGIPLIEAHSSGNNARALYSPLLSTSISWATLCGHSPHPRIDFGGRQWCRGEDIAESVQILDSAEPISCRSSSFQSSLAASSLNLPLS